MKPDKKTIRAWVDNSNLVEVIFQSLNDPDANMSLTEANIDACISASDLIEELEDKISELCEKVQTQGFEDGLKEARDEHEEVDKEQIGLTFAVEKFKDCRTLEDFMTEYRWIESMAMTYMK